jgi:hypothetical protein
MTDLETLYYAWSQISTGDGKEYRRDVIAFRKDLHNNMLSLQQRLRDETWTPSHGRTFYLRTEGKIREIHTVGVEDRIVHQILVLYFGLNAHFIGRTFGSIKGRGTLKANKQVRRDIFRSNFNYCIKFDVRKYYPSINKTILIELIRKKYKCEKSIRLFEKVIRSYKPQQDKSISIGALVSQNNGNYYLSPLDYFILQELRVKYYTRYVDDMVILVRDKIQGEIIIKRTSEFLKSLNLEFGKITLFPINKRRIDFCSYAVNQENVRLRTRIKKRFIRKLRQLDKKPQDGMYERNSVCSYLGYMKYCNSVKLLNNLKDEYNQVFVRIDRYAKKPRGKKNDTASSKPAGERIPQILQSSRHRTRAGHNTGQRGTRCRIRDYSGS